MLIVALSFTACVKVEDGSKTESDSQTVELPDPSTATIESDDNSFRVSWTKNSEYYGQLEITDNYTIPKGVIAVVTAGQKQVNLNCEYRRDIGYEKEYRCNIENADKIGSFYIKFPYERELLVLERGGNQDSSPIAVLTQFYIYESHGRD